MKKHNSFPRPRPYWKKTRSEKKYAYIYMKNALLQSSEALGGKFITDDWLDGTNTIIWIAFMGLRRPDYFRAALQTTSEAYKEAVSRAVYAFKENSHASHYESFSDSGQIQYCPDFNQRVAALLRGVFKDEAHATFEETARAEAILADARILSVREWWKKKPEYSWGCGLHGTIHVPSFTIANIESFIDRFLSSDCADYKGTEWTDFSSAELPAPFSNDGPIMSPKDWTQAEVLAAMKNSGKQD